MAYMTQEHKKEIAAAIKPILKKYNVKATLSVKHHSTIELNISKSAIDFEVGERGYIQISQYWLDRHYAGVAYDFLKEVFEVLNGGNHNNSDMMTDYYDVGWYSYVNVGRYDSPYQMIAA